MGKVDNITHEYIQQPDRFADLFNYHIFHGKRVIDKNNLKDINTVSLLNFIDSNGNNKSTQKIRDIFKECIVKDDGKAYYVLMGIENQSFQHYSMPVKNMFYEALNYYDQCNEIKKLHDEKKDLKGDEWLSGFGKDDRIKPIIALTIYWKPDEWTAPTRLSDMYNYYNSEIAPFVNDYSINLIQPFKMNDFDDYKTDLGAVFEYIKASSNKENLSNLLNVKKNIYSNVDVLTASLINIVTNSNISVEDMQVNEGGGVNMCVAIDEMIKDAKEEVRVEYEPIIAEKDKALLEKDKSLQEKDKSLQEKDKSLQEKDKSLQEKDKSIEDMSKYIAELEAKLGISK